MKKRNRLTICLVAGVLILAVSATAAFGSVNGYSKYKEAVKALALETDNFTANGTLKMICDGKEVVHVTEDYAMDGHNMSSHSISKDSMGSHEQYETILNGVNTWFDVNDRYYYQSEYETDSSSLGGNLLGVDQDDEMARRMVNFMEIAADTVVLAMGTHSQESRWARRTAPPCTRWKLPRTRCPPWSTPASPFLLTVSASPMTTIIP